MRSSVSYEEIAEELGGSWIVPKFLVFPPQHSFHQCSRKCLRMWSVVSWIVMIDLASITKNLNHMRNTYAKRIRRFSLSITLHQLWCPTSLFICWLVQRHHQLKHPCHGPLHCQLCFSFILLFSLSPNPITNKKVKMGKKRMVKTWVVLVLRSFVGFSKFICFYFNSLNLIL